MPDVSDTSSQSERPNVIAKKNELRSLLAERGVTNVEGLIDELDVEGAVATVRYFDDQPSGKGAGLLVHLLQSGEKNGYRREGERGRPAAGVVTARLLQAVRGSCRSPNGFTRDEARRMFAGKAKRLGVPVDDLVDEAMGAGWRFTEPDAAFDRRLPVVDRVAAYERLVSGKNNEREAA